MTVTPSSHLQVRVEDPDEGADGRVVAGFEDHESAWTVLSPERTNETMFIKSMGWSNVWYQRH